MTTPCYCGQDFTSIALMPFYPFGQYAALAIIRWVSSKWQCSRLNETEERQRVCVTQSHEDMPEGFGNDV